VSVHILHKDKPINADTALESARDLDLDAVLVIGLRHGEDGSSMALVAGGEEGVLNYGMLYWLIMEAQRQIHDSILD